MGTSKEFLCEGACKRCLSIAPGKTGDFTRNRRCAVKAPARVEFAIFRIRKTDDNTALQISDFELLNRIFTTKTTDYEISILDSSFSTLPSSFLLGVAGLLAGLLSRAPGAGYLAGAGYLMR